MSASSGKSRRCDHLCGTRRLRSWRRWQGYDPGKGRQLLRGAGSRFWPMPVRFGRAKGQKLLWRVCLPHDRYQISGGCPKLFRKKGHGCKHHGEIEGSVELAPLLGLSDAIVDIVETGSTLREHGLEVIEDIVPISARLIVNTASLKLRKQEIEQLVDAMEQKRREAQSEREQ